MEVRFTSDRFALPRLPVPWLRQLQLRRLPEPEWDRDLRAWCYDESLDEVRALRFLHDAYRVPFDADADERLEQLVDVVGLRSVDERRADLLERLRPYQKEGVEFAAAHKRALIADAMGLGKTLQALAVLESLDAFPAVVVCPASVKSGWQAEVLKWTPWRSCQVLDTGRDGLDEADVTILNPELLGPQLEDLEQMRPRAVVLDESHYFKNPRAQRSRHAARLCEGVEIRLALTGTPIQNRRDDLIQQLQLLGQLEEVLHPYRGVLPHWWTPEKGALRWDQAANAIDQLPRGVLHGRLRDVCLIRRTKHQVAQDLPSFERVRREVPMGDRDAYLQAESAFVTWVDKLRAKDESAWGHDRFVGRQHLSRLRREAALAKRGAVLEWADTMHADRQTVVFFAYHKAVVEAYAKELPGKVAAITGDTNPHTRRVLIDALGQHDFLVATMDSLGQGVDGLQHHANHVAFLELDWTPTKHEQCEGRLHRIGQTEPVTAWYFTAEDSIEGAMIRIIDAKWQDVQGIVDGKAPDGFMAKALDALLAGEASTEEASNPETSRPSYEP